MLSSLQGRRTKKAQTDVEWKRPPTKWMKINVDTSRIQQEKSSIIACKLRDNEGKISRTMTRKVIDYPILQVECLTAWAGNQTAAEMDLSMIIIENDSLVVFIKPITGNVNFEANHQADIGYQAA